eukprot:TRINITY_DN1001_c0_g1_i4.p2 TRINITY_DN1001_c0_g1~~TRINITY_DN1001_c0_g1_i4.p2  ORF type:complete len:116 (-),score=4.41 TRINITY_DN1001_c0_g1_i4:430-777(-)
MKINQTAFNGSGHFPSLSKMYKCRFVCWHVQLQDYTWRGIRGYLLWQPWNPCPRHGCLQNKLRRRWDDFCAWYHQTRKTPVAAWQQQCRQQTPMGLWRPVNDAERQNYGGMWDNA